MPPETASDREWCTARDARSGSREPYVPFLKEGTRQLVGRKVHEIEGISRKTSEMREPRIRCGESGGLATPIPLTFYSCVLLS